MNSKIFACYRVLNEELFIAASIESIRDFVDGIIVIDRGSKVTRNDIGLHPIRQSPCGEFYEYRRIL